MLNCKHKRSVDNSGRCYAVGGPPAARTARPQQLASECFTSSELWYICSVLVGEQVSRRANELQQDASARRTRSAARWLVPSNYVTPVNCQRSTLVPLGRYRATPPSTCSVRASTGALRDRTAQATGVSRKTIKSILDEADTSTSTGLLTFSTPKKKEDKERTQTSTR
ncbi:hypothetical protein EVAR_33153_1 [Eumeta japonica]|uniref:Uncharacterized protein n=1 Tax=Eumeta variegata TaxID=151549 RepID=A0A4C1ZY28_EUMVA|nr:hypothetical protein EVAR_33153_1 [Eumeta japonica]